jgi:hypothetical protein
LSESEKPKFSTSENGGRDRRSALSQIYLAAQGGVVDFGVVAAIEREAGEVVKGAGALAVVKIDEEGVDEMRALAGAGSVDRDGARREKRSARTAKGKG